MTQTYSNHAHRPWLTLIVWALSLASAVCLVLGLLGHDTVGNALGFLIAAVIVLAWISRSYTTRLQDRIIRLEMANRAQRLLSPAQQTLLASLGRPQVVALRFASDAELPALVERAAAEHLTGDAIKRAIKDWLPDWNRT
jgi:hypothetical protein